MKKLLVCVLVMAMICCSAVAETSPEMSEHTIGCFMFSLPPSWSEDGETDDGSILTNGYREETPNGNNRVLTAIYTDATDYPKEDTTLTLLYKSIVNGMNVKDASGETITVNGSNAYLWSGSWTLGTGDSVPIAGLVYKYGNGILVLTYNHLDSSTEELLDMMISISNTIRVSGLDQETSKISVAEIDWKSLTDSEIDEILEAGQAELDLRQRMDGATLLYNISDVYHTSKLSFSISGLYLYEKNDAQYLVVGFDWTNDSDTPETFWSQLSVTAYQYGIEIDYKFPQGFDGQRMTSVLPGYSMTSYNSYLLNGNGEVTVVVDDLIDLTDHFEDIYITVNPCDLPLFQP